MIAEFLTYLEYHKRYSRHTVAAYRRDLMQFAEWCKGEKELLKVDSSDIRSWLLYLLSEKNTKSTVHRKMSSLKSFYKYLLQQHLITKNPAVSVLVPKKEKRLPAFLKQQETKRLFEEVHFPESFEGMRDEVILNLFYATGVRVSELADLKVASIDYTRKTIKVLGKRNKERYIPLLSLLVPLLQRYVEFRNQEIGSNSYLFVNNKNVPLTRGQLYYIVKKYLTQVSSALKCSPHVLRHTFATQMLSSGADINALKELLGHSSLAATQVYTHTTREQLKKDYKQAHPRA